MTGHDRVVIERGTRKVFASAIDWPGWCRSAETEEEALATLGRYADRYARVAALADTGGVPSAAASFAVVERLPGNATTDFGAPDAPAAAETEPMTDAECERQIGLLRACWRSFDDTAGRVSEELRTGPRGGGRNRRKLIEHTLEAERSYTRQIGVRTPPDGMGTRDGLATHRDAVGRAIRAMHANGETPGRWPLRYFVRRAAWHVLDHAWEMEDKDLTADRA